MSIGEIDQRMYEIKREMTTLVGNLDSRSMKDMADLKAEHEELTQKRANLEAAGKAEARENAPVPGNYDGGFDRIVEGSDTGSGGAEYRSMFPGVSVSESRDFSGFGEFVDAVASGRFDPRLNERAGTGAVPSDGGFSLDVGYEAWLLDESLEGEIVRNLPGISIVGMKARTVKIPGWDSSDHSAGATGGMTGHWVGEGADGTEVTPTMNQRTLEARKLVILSRASLELVEDGLSYGQQLESGMKQSLGWYLDGAFIAGDGVAKPRGILNSNCKIEVAKESGQGAATVVLDNVSKMYSRMLPAAQRRAVWIAHPDVLPQLYNLSIEVGTGGSWVQPMREENGSFFLMGRPVHFSEHCENLGTAGDLAFFDPKSYAVGIRQNSMRLDFSDHKYFSSAERLFRSMIRVDGACVLDSAITLKDGSTTVSPVVTLADRS